jgi:hypothetical protein
MNEDITDMMNIWVIRVELIVKGADDGVYTYN